MSRGSILLVEDSKDVRAVVAEIVSVFGYDVTLAADGDEAWTELSERKFDLIISDMGLPDMGGDELLRRMRFQDIDIPAILITGVDDVEGKAKIEEIPNCSYIQKPFNIEDLKSAINERLKKNNPGEKKTGRIKK